MTESNVNSLIVGLTTAIPTIFAILFTRHSTERKIEAVRTDVASNAKGAEVAVQAATDTASKAVVVAETIHNLVNSKLTAEVRDKEIARRERDTALDLLRSHNIPLPQFKSNGSA
jgi:hypothetical protein